MTEGTKPPLTSRLPGFHKLDLTQRIEVLVEAGALSAAQGQHLAGGRPLLPIDAADKMVENVIGLFALPFAVAANFRVNGTDRLVPMVIEEPSVVAALSSAAKLVRDAGGFASAAAEVLLAGQIQLIGIDDPDASLRAMKQASQSIVADANELLPNLVARGGGCRELEFFKYRLPDGRWTVIVHVLVDTKDAMGANAVNSLCEQLAPSIAALAGGSAFLRILSNLADRSVFEASATIPAAALETDGHDGTAVRDGIVLATQTANLSPHRAATHNKGIMNGIDAVALATGNDWRAIEAGAHAYAVRDGCYRSLTDWSVTADGALAGRIRIPLKVGIVGGSLRASPSAEAGLNVVGVKSAAELAAIMAAVGLAQNFSALRALVTHGIQRGHMRLHARSVASAAGIPEPHFGRVVRGLLDSGEIKVWKAQELYTEVLAHAAEQPVADREAGSVGHGSAAGKVILLGEHGVVYGRQALALPLPKAVSATCQTNTGRTEIAFVERGLAHAVDPAAQSGMAAALRLILRRLDIADQAFQLRVESRIPLAMGLGASAAVAVALIRALDDLFSLGLDVRAIDRLAFECEKLAHGTPSGVDNNLATYAEPVLYSKGATIRTQALALSEVPPIVVAVSGIRASTQGQVDGVRRRRERMPALYDTLFDEMGEMSAAGASALRASDYDTLGALMNVAHGLLNAIEVSHPELEKMVQIARSEGALGAKLTGGGGGGSIVALCPEREDAVARALQAAGYVVMRMQQ